MAGDSRVKGFRRTKTKTKYIRCDLRTTAHEKGISLESQIVSKNNLLIFNINATEKRDNDIDVSHKIKARDEVMSNIRCSI